MLLVAFQRFAEYSEDLIFSGAVPCHQSTGWLQILTESQTRISFGKLERPMTSQINAVDSPFLELNCAGARSRRRMSLCASMRY
ncbi:hypothetical protein VTK73DRAFT_5161 [Phialemonium thermophilum]|uniref:Uncharacterized protein n=1 Tax=Phialemonium thermophilum TaxID=223376 RepID=A0ABR3XXN1_9PEZI